MATKVYINLPVKDIKQSKSFFSELNYYFDEQISDELSACLIINDHIFVMLLQEEYFKSIIKKNIGNTKLHSEVLISLDAASKQEIENIISKAKQLGALVNSEPQNYSWMYQHGFEDLDGHLWEFIYTDNDQLPDLI